MIKVNDDLEREVYEAIGRFIFWFSKLEGMMKADLAGMLDLDNDYLDPVTSAFDFAQLCKVLAAMRRKGSAPDDQKKVDEFYNEVFKLNDRRNQVAHGDWTLSGARVVSRHTRTATIHFDNASTVATACAPSITVPGRRFANVKVPSGEVKLNGTFTLTAGTATTLLLDFDGESSIEKTGNGYLMKPVVRLVSVQ